MTPRPRLYKPNEVAFTYARPGGRIVRIYEIADLPGARRLIRHAASALPARLRANIDDACIDADHVAVIAVFPEPDA